MIALMLISVISFSYQTSFGSGQVVKYVYTDSHYNQEANIAAAAAVVGIVAGVVGAAYAAGYALGRAYGHYRYGEQTPMEYSVIKHVPADFSAFDK